MLSVAERFVSINGEGRRAGELAVFIRFCGCNLNCRYCDTKWANLPDTPFESLSPEEIVSYVLYSGVRNVTLTGGEPLLQPELPALVQALMENHLRVEIETNGSLPLGPLLQGKHRPVFTVDHKSPFSGMNHAMLPENYELLQEQDTVKFVVADREDLEEALSEIETCRLTRRCGVYLSPVFGQIEAQEIVAFMKEHRMNDVRLQLQLHKYIWDPMQKGV